MWCGHRNKVVLVSVRSKKTNTLRHVADHANMNPRQYDMNAANPSLTLVNTPDTPHLMKTSMLVTSPSEISSINLAQPHQVPSCDTRLLCMQTTALSAHSTVTPMRSAPCSQHPSYHSTQGE